MSAQIHNEAKALNQQISGWIDSLRNIKGANQPALDFAEAEAQLAVLDAAAAAQGSSGSGADLVDDTIATTEGAILPVLGIIALMAACFIAGRVTVDREPAVEVRVVQPASAPCEPQKQRTVGPKLVTIPAGDRNA